MDHLGFRGRIGTPEDVLPDGLTVDEVEAELDEIRQRLGAKRRQSWLVFAVAVGVLWQVFGGGGLLDFALAVAGLLAMSVSLTRLQDRKMARLEARGALVIEAGRKNPLVEGGGG